jgi:RNA recognition motif-containing protein
MMNIYVGNLSYEVSGEDLRQAFEAFGQVSSATIVKDKYSGQPRGFGFVEMPERAEGQTAIQNLNGKDFGRHECRMKHVLQRPGKPGEEDIKGDRVTVEKPLLIPMSPNL